MTRCAAQKCAGLPAMLFLVLAAATVSAQTTLPKPATAYDDQPIRRGHPADAPTTRASTGITAGRAATFLDLPRVLMALGIVLGLILILRLVARKLFPNATASRASEVIRVLGRSPITPRQQVLLVQVGKRILVVADNGTQMSALSEIKEPDEVASLVGRLGPTNPADGDAFHAALDQSQKQFEDNESQAAAEEESIPAAQSEIAGLMDKVRGLAKQLGR